MVKFKHVSLLLGSIVFLLILSACGGKTVSEDHFVFATWASGEELTQFNEIVDRVNENADGEYTVEALSIPSDYYIKLSTLIAANNSPDLFWMTQELVSQYAEMGAIADISDFLNESDPLQPDKFYGGVLESATYEGNYYGVPWIANPLMVYYNKNLFDEQGIPHPSPTDDWTWDEFIDIADQLTVEKTDSNDNPYQQFGTVVDGWPNIETFIWAGGSDIIAENEEDILLDEAGTIAGLEILDRILSTKITPSYSQVSSLGSNDVWFEQQRVGMFMGGIQDNFEEKLARKPEEEQFEIGYAPMPVGLDGEAHAFNWTASTVVNIDQAENPLIYQALEDMTLEFFKWKIAPPVTGELELITEVDPLKEPALETIEHALQIARSANYIPEWNEINHRLWTELYTGLLSDPGNFDYESSVKSIAKYARELIEERQ